MDNRKINYSQCWEDPEILTKALKINDNDTVISVTSGGDNTLALLLANPRTMTSIDLNSAQNYLLELKIAAVKTLAYPEFRALLGVKSDADRSKLYGKVRPLISSEARAWWDAHLTLIEKGIINSGRFEKFLTRFRMHVLPFIHSKATINQFLWCSSLDTQREFYQAHWNTLKWRLYFRFTTSRFILNLLARQRGMFKYVDRDKIGDRYITRLEKNLQTILLSNNYFMQYCLTGEYQKSLPPYLNEKNYRSLRQNSTKVAIVTNDLLTHLQFLPKNSLSKYNLSDIFEALSTEETLQLWHEIIRTAKKGARVVYWDNLIERPVPEQLESKVTANKQLQIDLFQQDRVFFYGGVHIYTINK